MSKVLKKPGFNMGMTAGLWIMALGFLIFIPVAYNRSYLLFITGLFVQGIGLKDYKLHHYVFITPLLFTSN